VNKINFFFRNYGLIIGGGGVSEDKRLKGKLQNKALYIAMKTFDEEVSENFGNLNPNFFKTYANLIKQMNNYYTVNHQVILEIGMLQLLRRLVTQ
jgi:hypothetical protein